MYYGDEKTDTDKMSYCTMEPIEGPLNNVNPKIQERKAKYEIITNKTMIWDKKLLFTIPP